MIDREKLIQTTARLAGMSKELSSVVSGLEQDAAKALKGMDEVAAKKHAEGLKRAADMLGMAQAVAGGSSKKFKNIFTDGD